MTLRPPQTSSSSARRGSALDYEIAQEQVAALGRLGRGLEAALAALSDYERTHSERSAERAQLVQGASDALWCFVVQREAVGLCDARSVFRQYDVPSEVRNRMGVFAVKRRPPR
jgi:hypothetical protein